MGSGIAKLQWDSDFFGLEIGKWTPNSEFDFGDQDKVNSFDCIYIFLPPEQVNEKIEQRALDLGAYQVDEKVVYAIPVDSDLGKRSSDGSIDFRDAIGESVTCDLLSLAFESGAMSRFLLDHRFGRQRFEQLYREWLLKSLSGERAAAVVVARRATRDVGLVTLGPLGQDLVATIGLVAVAGAEQGKGIGRAMLHHTIAAAAKLGVGVVHVATQRANRGACGLYESVGAKILSVQKVLHLWPRAVAPR